MLFLLLFSQPVVSNSLQPHGLQHARLLCPLLSPEVCPSSCPLHWWCHPAISSSDALFSFCPQSFPASGTFPMIQLFTSDDQNTGFSASGSVLPTNIQGWCPLRFTGLISLLSKGLSRVFSINCTSIFLRLNYSCSFGFTTNLRGIYRNLWPPWCLRGKEFTCQCKRQGLGRSPGKGNGNPLKCSCLENPMDREACGVTELDTTWWLKQ